MQLKRQSYQGKYLLYFGCIFIMGFQSIVILGSDISSNNGSVIDMGQKSLPLEDPWIRTNSEAILAPKASFQAKFTPVFVGYTYWHYNDGFTKHKGSDMRCGYDYNFWDESWRGYSEFNIESIPDNSTINSISIQFEVTDSIPECDMQNAEVQIFKMSIRPSIGDKIALYDDAGDEQKFYPSSLEMSDGYYPDAASLYTLNNEAKIAFQQALQQDWFALGFMDESTPEIDEGIVFHITQLKVEYSTTIDDMFDISPNNNDVITEASIIQVGPFDNLRCMDVDFYKISVTQQALLNVNVSYYRPDGDLNVTVFDPNYQPVISEIDYRSDVVIELSYCVKSQNTGWYYIGVSKLETKNNSYSLAVGFSNCSQSGSLIEPNDNLDEFFLDVIPFIVIVILLCVIVNVVHNKRVKVQQEHIKPLTNAQISSSSESAFKLEPNSELSHHNNTETHIEEKNKDEKDGSDITCRFCGSTLRKDATFCHYCGTKFD